jgi:outer membrane protein OmpA-like peptidoglycan-associated protein
VPGRSGSITAPVQLTAATPIVVERWESAEDISFQQNRIEIQAKCTSKIARIATWVNRNPLVIVALDPHADQSAAFTGESDTRLQERRMRSVRDALVAAGIAPDRIRTGPVGDRAPLCRQATAECRELNRRVEVLVATPKVTAERH